MKVITQNEIPHELHEALTTPPRQVIVNYTDAQVNYGFDEKPNFDYCRQHNIDCVDIGRRGGAFVVNKGDIGIGIVVKTLDNSKALDIEEKFVQHLKEKGFNVTQDSNDVLIDGYKVFAWASHYYKEYDALFMSIHFTMSVDVELIQKICTKPMNKVPKGLSDFGLTREDILSFIERTV